MYEMNDIAAAVGRHPFQPITLQLSNGATIEITHPDGLVFTDYSILVFSGRGKTKGAIESYQVIGLDHVVSVEPAAMK